MNRKALVSSLVCILMLLIAPKSYSVDHFGAWAGVFSRSDSGNESVNLWTEFQWRQKETNNRQSLFRFGPLWKLNDNNELGLLYGIITTDGRVEHRITQQYVYSLNSFSMRHRLEQRMLQGFQDINWRMRNLFRYQWELGTTEKFVLWNEAFWFLNQTRWSTPYIFDRNRFFVGLSHSMKPLRLEWGYMNQSIKTKTDTIVEHLAVIYLFY